MANTKQSKKRAKQAVSRRLKNLNRKNAIKTAIKKFNNAFENKESKEVVVALLKDVESKMARSIGKNVFHKNTVRRKVSSLAKKVTQEYRV